MITLAVIIFGLISGCFLSILVGLIGRDRNIGFGWAFLISLIFTPIVGLLITLISDKRDPGQERKWGCLGYLLGILGIIFMAFAVLLFAGIITLL